MSTTHAPGGDWSMTADERTAVSTGTKIGPFTVVPNMDPYTRPPTRLPGFRIAGYCTHLSPGASHVAYVHEADAIAWCEQHVATYHGVDPAEQEADLARLQYSEGQYPTPATERDW